MALLGLLCYHFSGSLAEGMSFHKLRPRWKLRVVRQQQPFGSFLFDVTD